MGLSDEYLTIPEAAKLLRIGRTLAYRLARRYLETGGAEGIPVIKVGRLLRVPRTLLVELAGTQPVAMSPADVPMSSARASSRTRSSRSAAQLTLL